MALVCRRHRLGKLRERLAKMNEAMNASTRSPGVAVVEAEIEPEPLPAWAADDSWRSVWEAPRNWIYGESRELAAVQSLVGPPRERGYLVPVDVVLEHDQNTIRARVGGARVGSLARSVAEEVSAAMDDAGLHSIRVPGVIRGGALMAPHLGVLVWFGHGESGVRPEDAGGRVSWPPSPGEGI